MNTDIDLVHILFKRCIGRTVGRIWISNFEMQGKNRYKWKLKFITDTQKNSFGSFSVENMKYDSVIFVRKVQKDLIFNESFIHEKQFKPCKAKDFKFRSLFNVKTMAN